MIKTGVDFTNFSFSTSISRNFFCFQSAAKFSMERAQESLDWIEAVVEKKIEYVEGSALQDQQEFGTILKDGSLLCE